MTELLTRFRKSHPTKEKQPFIVVNEGLLILQVEAAGIEPASRGISMRASTCVSD